MEQTNQSSARKEVESKPPLKTNWKFIAIVTVLGFLASGVMLTSQKSLYQSQPVQVFQQQIQKPAPKKIQQPEKGQTEIDTSTWQTYRNDEFGFEVRYPENWEVSLGDPPKSSSPSFGPAKNFRPLVLISVLSLQEFEDEKQLKLFDEGLLEQRNIEIDGVRGERLVITMPKSLPETLVFFEKGEFGFIFYGTEGAEEEKSIEIFNQILSTFRFVGKEQSVGPLYKTISVEWEEALNILRSGQVTGVFQAHDLNVHLTLKDGTTTAVTKQPQLDLIYDEIAKCGSICKDILVATE